MQPFSNILNYVQTHPRSASLKERKDKQQLVVTFEEVRSVEQAKRVLAELESAEEVE